MIAIQFMRQRNISAVYQTWLTASPAMQCDLGELPPLPKDAVDVLIRICSPSFDLPARVTGLAAIRAMASWAAFRGDMYSSQLSARHIRSRCLFLWYLQHLLPHLSSTLAAAKSGSGMAHRFPKGILGGTFENAESGNIALTSN
jgi:hypothetical protein